MKAIHTYRIAWKSWGVIVFLSLAFNARGGEFDTYRYELIKSQDDKVCKHMEGIYNTRFTRPFDHRHVTQVQGIDIPPSKEDKLRLYRIKYSLYPTSPEYEAVTWRLRTYHHSEGNPNFGQQPTLIAEVDINNDGMKEVAIKSQFFEGHNGFENLDVLRGEFDLQKKQLTPKDFSGREGPQPNSIATCAVTRLFIYQGVTYVHCYDFFRPEPGIKGGAFDPPEQLRIMRYVIGGRSRYELFTPEDICEFTMTTVKTK